MLSRRDSIRARIRHFDLVALLNLLESMGYRTEDVIFRSAMTRVSAQSMVEDIEFLPEQKVIVWLNMGMLSYQSPLPTYFLKMLELEVINVQSFIDFVQFFSDRLIRDYLCALRPEGDPRLGLGWQRSGRHLVRLLGLSSPSTLHWLFSMVFPELEIAVYRDRHWRELSPGHVKLGGTPLGAGAVFGGRTRVKVRGFSIELLSEEDSADNGAPWAHEALRRLEGQILPMLADYDLSIKVIVVIRHRSGWARLSHDSLLGYDALRGGKPKVKRAVIFRGKVDRAQPSRKRPPAGSVQEQPRRAATSA